jgi:phenylacetate-CoA ligase
MTGKGKAPGFFDEKETMSQLERRDYYDRRISEMVRLGYAESRWVKKTLDERGLSPSGIGSVKDLAKLPKISREELVRMEHADPPFAGLCREGLKTDRIFTSPGPVYEPHLTEEDPVWARGYHAAGFSEADIVLNTFSYHMVAAGLTFHSGLRRLGATVVPSGTSSTENQVQLMRDLGVTAYAGTPSFLMAIIKKAEELGYSLRDDFKLRRASFVAEPLQPSLRRRFEEEYGIDTYQMYGATEVGDIAYECREKGHWHICEEVVVEIVDPSTGEGLPAGILGEVTVTRLNSMFFLFRFGTGDLSSCVEEPCPCGRTSFRLTGVSGRVGEATKVRGMFITPSQLKKVAARFGDLRLQAVVDRSGFKDRLTIRVEAGERPDRATFQKEFEEAVKEICTVKIDGLEILEKGGLSDKDGLIVDRREWK